MALMKPGRTFQEASPDKAAPGTGASVMSPGMLTLVAAALVLAALNLRPAISGLGPLLEEVRRGLGMNATIAGLLTSVPALCFAVFGACAPRLARRHGPVLVLVAGMAAITAGLALRPLAGSTPVFLITSALALAGIAVSNVLMPVIVKRYFPDRVGAMTGLYSMALAVGTSGAAALTVPLTRSVGGGWRVGLGMWAVLAALALVAWLLVALRDRSAGRGGHQDAGGAGQQVRITRSRTAWALAVFFGFQAGAAYVIIGWLPQIFRDAGLSAAGAGLLLAVAMGVGIPLSFAVPPLAARLPHQGPLIAVLGACGLAGYAGLWLAPAAGAWAWAVLLGVSNCAFPVVLTLLGLRSRTGAGVAKLSAFVQSTGYLLSIPAPLLVGMLYDSSGSWHAPLILLSTLMVLQISVGVLAGRNRVIEDGC
jgi:CP family cyanate transporter-like MFS transporter